MYIKQNKSIKRLNKLIECGLLPKALLNLSSIQNEAYDLAINDIDTPIDRIIKKYVNYTNNEYKQKFLYRKLKNGAYQPRKINKGIITNIKPEDIALFDVCPLIGIKLNYNITKTFFKNNVTIDRIDNSKGYIKGNVWTISSLANVMKSDATNEELKIFCENILKLYGDTKNYT